MQQNSLDHFSEEGFWEFPGSLDEQAATALYAKIYASRPFDQDLFISESEWNNGTQSHAHTNPRVGRNILESFPDSLAFVEKNPQLISEASALLGKDFTWLYKKIVSRLPLSSLPQWVVDFIDKKPANTLNAFIKPEFRDISYYLENDLHQDIIDYARLPADQRDHRLISLYVQLDEVSKENAPLCLLPRTHQYGATAYQHDVKKISHDQWLYDTRLGTTMETTIKHIVGPAGHATMWHSCLLHGARFVREGKPRLVLRYMLGRSPTAESCGLDDVNMRIKGALYPEVDYSPGASIGKGGKWQLVDTDFTRLES